MKKDPTNIGYSQELYGEEEYKDNYYKENSYTSAQRKILIGNFLQQIMQLQKEKIRVVNRVTLAKFVCFVVPED